MVLDYRMMLRSLKKVAICVLFSLVFFSGYCFAESAGFVYDAHEHSSKTCEHQVSSWGLAINIDNKLSNTLTQSCNAKNVQLAYTTDMPGIETGRPNRRLSSLRVPLLQSCSPLKSKHLRI